MIVDRPLFYSTQKQKRHANLGLASAGKCAIVSIYSLKKYIFTRWKDKLAYLVFHEVGHIFGLIPPERRKKLILPTSDYYNHCINRKCVMYPYTDYFKELDFAMPFCAQCLMDLRENFIDFTPYKPF